MANGRCRMHGGKSTGPKDQRNNKNAVTTGEYESIWTDTLDEEEKTLYYKVNLDRLIQVNEDIRLTDIRLRRMMLRIKELQNKEYITISRKKGIENGVDTDVGEVENPLIQIQNIEEAIRRVQEQKIKTIDVKQKHKQEIGTKTEERK